MKKKTLAIPENNGTHLPGGALVELLMKTEAKNLKRTSGNSPLFYFRRNFRFPNTSYCLDYSKVSITTPMNAHCQSVELAAAAGMALDGEACGNHYMWVARISYPDVRFSDWFRQPLHDVPN